MLLPVLQCGCLGEHALHLEHEDTRTNLAWAAMNDNYIRPLQTTLHVTETYNPWRMNKYMHCFKSTHSPFEYCATLKNTNVTDPDKQKGTKLMSLIDFIHSRKRISEIH